MCLFPGAVGDSCACCSCAPEPLPVPVHAFVVVPVEEVRLGAERAHVRVDADELEHGARAALLHADDQRVGELFVAEPLRARAETGRVARLGFFAARARAPRARLLAPVERRAPRGRRGSELAPARVRLRARTLGAGALSARAPALLEPAARHDRSGAEQHAVADVREGQREREDEHEPAAAEPGAGGRRGAAGHNPTGHFSMGYRAACSQPSSRSWILPHHVSPAERTPS